MAKAAKKVANDNKSKAKNTKNSKKVVKLVTKTSPKAVDLNKKAKETAKSTPKPTVANNNYEFKVGDHLVYPTHGVGKVTAVESTEVAGMKVTLYVLNFEKEKMTLRVPVNRAAAVGLRRLASTKQLDTAISVLKSKPKAGRGMWSRRATEYGQKINSGNIEFIAQVVRDLHKNVDDPERSYSERMIYESAFGRLAGEIAAVKKLDAKQAEDYLVKTLKKKAA